MVAASAALALAAPAVAAAQFYTADGSFCQCVQPVVQNVYRTVPVTEYQELRQTVQRPVVEQHFEDRQVTEYHPITETRTAEVPSIAYEDITEYQTVQRDFGAWQTQYYARPEISPCQFDPRGGFAGWWNRTAFSIRQAFTPKIVAQRYYVPNVVAQTVPVVRRVARPVTRQVAYNVTRLEPVTTTRKVAVNTVRMVSEDVVRKVPVTVMRSVPIGTRMAYAVTPFGGSSTATALAPTPDISASRRAATASPERSANAGGAFNGAGVVPSNAQQFKRQTPGAETPAQPEFFQRDPASFPKDVDATHIDSPSEPSVGAASFETIIQPREKAAAPAGDPSSAREVGFRPTAMSRRSAYPSIVRVQRAAGTYRSSVASPDGPALASAGNN
jgi:hypothetical protein